MAALRVSTLLSAPSRCALSTRSSSMSKHSPKTPLEANNAKHSPRLVCKAKTDSSVMTYESDSLATVFSDEKKGIVCYLTESGEITCEGFDEGPHFHPSAEQHQLRVVSGNIYSPVAAGVPFLPDETWYMSVKEDMGGVFCEGKDES